MENQLVGVKRFELATSSSQSWRSTRLSYTPSLSAMTKIHCGSAKKIRARRPDCVKNHHADDRLLPHREAMRIQKEKGAEAPFANLARPERFELPTTKFVAWYSIQLS